MSEHTNGHIRLTLGNLLAAVAACGLMAAVLPPSLVELKQRMEPVTCANNLRACYQGWNVYGSDYDGVWMAPWDNVNLWPGVSSGNTWMQQYPYTMVHFVTGGGLPEGETVWMQDRPGGSWYSEDGGTWPAALCELEDAPQLQCATTVARGPALNMWYKVTSYSYAVMGWGQIVTGLWGYTTRGYPTPGLMTHPSSTALLHDLGGILTDGQPNAWSVYEGWPTDPHSGKSNYVMCDGHVELLHVSQTTPEMWQSLWTPDPPAGGGTN